MTDARVSQLAVEVLRTNLDPDVRVSQLAVEVLRPNAARGVAGGAGSYTLAGQTAALRSTRKLAAAVAAFTLSGQASGAIRTFSLSSARGDFTLTGQDAALKLPGKMLAAVGTFTLTGQNATGGRKVILVAAVNAFTLAGQTAGLSVPLRNLIAARGQFNLTGNSASLTKIFNIIDPVSGLTILRRLRAQTSPYTDADAAYNAWAATLGVSATGTSYTASTALSASDFVATTRPPVDGGVYSGLDIPHGGAIALYMSDPGVYTASSANYSTAGADFGFLTMPTQRPVFTLGAANNRASVTPSLNYNLKLRQGINPSTGAAETIIIYTRAEQTTQAYPIRCAYRVGNGLFEAVFTVDAANIPSGGFARVQYIIANESSDIPTSGQVLIDSFVNTVNVVADDVSALRPFMTEQSGIAEATATKGNKYATSSDTVTCDPAIIGDWSLTLADAVTAGNTLANAYRPSGIIRELITAAEATVSSWKFTKSLVDRANISGALKTAFPATITDVATLTGLVTVFRAIVIAERLGILGTPQAINKFGAQLVDLMRASDELRRFLGGSLADSVTTADTLAQKARLAKTSTDTVAIAATISNKLLLRITSSETFALDDTELVKWIFKPTLTDQVTIDVGYISPGGTFTTWAVNTRTGAVTEYSNYEFNSFAQVGHKYLGASSSGLYELNGNDDAGEDIIPHIRSGYAQFGGSKYSSFKAAYLGMRGSGDIILKLDTGDGKTYTYQTVVQDMQSTKVRLGKGLRARYFAFELIGTGPDFDLDTIEFIPLVAQRRV